MPASQTVPTVWLTLAFAEPVTDGALGIFALSCGGELQPISTHRLDQDSDTVVINPAGDLPASSDCELSWTGPAGEEILPFSVFAAAPTAQVAYDRSDPSTYAPFPDDIWLESDPTTRTGVRIDLPTPDREQDVQNVLGRMKDAAGMLDGFSPIGALVVELSEAPDPSSLPRTPPESLDPLATVGLFDLTPGSTGYGRRVPFKLHIRAVRTLATPMQHALIIYPSIPLTPRGRYGLVVTRRALAAEDQPFDPSSFMLAALGDAMGGEHAAVTEVRALTSDVLDVLASSASPPIFADDVALVTRFSVRSNDDFPLTPLTMKEQVLALPPPSFQITSVLPDFSDEVGAIVEGTWQAPEWRVGPSIARGSDGRPIIISAKDVPFILAIPKAAESSSVPIAMYQHGNPGSAENEVPWQARSYMAENGFAVIGFSDTITRDVGADLDAQRLAIMTPLLAAGILPEYWIQTTGEQLSFLRLIEQLGDLDVLPDGDPDGQPDLDVGASLSYIGISEGANKGQAFVAYAPEVRAAALVAGGMRLGEILFYQDIIGPGGLGTATLDVIGDLLAPNLRPVDLWIGFSLFQLGFDPQDPHNHAAFMYANPLEVAGTFRKPSVLVQEGIADTLVPNNATRSLAYTLGPVPHVAPIRVPIPYLSMVAGPLTANIDFETTSAYAHYVPAGIFGLVPTPGCAGQPEGHYCAQTAPSSIEQRVIFFQTAVGETAPTIVNPFE
jgi:hypothetical protein